MEMAESGSGIKHLEVHIIERMSQRDHWGKMYHALSHVEDIYLWGAPHPAPRYPQRWDAAPNVRWGLRHRTA